MGGRTSVISIKDPLTVTVANTMDVSVEKDSNNNIISIDIPGLSKISIGNIITVSAKKFRFKINSIESKNIMGLPVYDLIMAPRTKASLFVLPMLPGNRQSYYYDTLLLNCFVGTKDRNDVIALLFRFSGMKSFISLEESLKKLKSFIKTEDPTNATVLFVFDVPEKYKKNYQKFINGKYSEMDTDYKYRILNFHNASEDGTIGQILFKGDERKHQLEEIIGQSLPENAELLSFPDIEQEIYDKKVYSI
jgi:hypothetical protein